MGFTLTTIPTGALLPASGKKVGGGEGGRGRGCRGVAGGERWRGMEGERDGCGEMKGGRGYKEME